MDVAGLVTGIAMLKCLGSSKSKIFWALRAPPDPTCITRQSRKIPLFFVPPDSSLVQTIMFNVTLFSTRFTKSVRYYDSKKEKQSPTTTSKWKKVVGGKIGSR